MSENFMRLKRRARAVALIKSALIALACGMLCAGVMLYLTSHKVIDADPLIFTIIAGGAALILSGAVTFLILNKTDKSLARLLDRDFDLHERVGTMLEYGKEENTMSSLQREDTENQLSKIKSSSLKLKRLWIYVTALVAGAAILVAAILLIPPKTPAGPKPDSPFSITPLQVRAMEELIDYVTDSAMESPYREEVALALTDALAELKIAKTTSERDEVIGRATEKILESTDNASSALEIINILVKSDSSQVRQLATAINYYNYKRGGEWDGFTTKMTELREALTYPESEGVDDAKRASEVRALLSRAAASISLGLSRSQIPDSDALYVVLLRFAEQSGDEGVHGLASLAVSSENMSYDEIQMHLGNSFNTMNVEIFNALDVKRENTSVGEYAVTRMCELFGCPVPKFERPLSADNGSSGGGEGGDTESGGMGGAIGSGTEYGSDELVFDPMTGEFVEYGTIIDRYYQIMFNKIQGDFYTEDEKEALKKYFEILYGGFDEDK